MATQNRIGVPSRAQSFAPDPTRDNLPPLQRPEPTTQPLPPPPSLDYGDADKELEPFIQMGIRDKFGNPIGGGVPTQTRTLPPPIPPVDYPPPVNPRSQQQPIPPIDYPPPVPRRMPGPPPIDYPPPVNTLADGAGPIRRGANTNYEQLRRQAMQRLLAGQV